MSGGTFVQSSMQNLASLAFTYLVPVMPNSLWQLQEPLGPHCLCQEPRSGVWLFESGVHTKLGRVLGVDIRAGSWLLSSAPWCMSEIETVPAEIGSKLDQVILIWSKFSVIECLLWAGTVPCVPWLSPLRSHFCYPHFTDGEAKFQRGEVTYPRLPRPEERVLGFNPGHLAPELMLWPWHPTAHCG